MVIHPTHLLCLRDGKILRQGLRAGVLVALVAALAGSSRDVAAADAGVRPEAHGGSSPIDLMPGTVELGAVAGGAPSVITAGLNEEEAAGRKVALLSVRYGRVLLRRETFALQYFADASPLVVETENQIGGEEGSDPLMRETTWGAGIAPLGFRLLFRPGARLKPYVAASGGLLLFREEVPRPGARRYAFTGDIEAGVQYWTSNNRSLAAGVRFHHISNANTGTTNPGLNALVYFVGFSLHRR